MKKLLVCLLVLSAIQRIYPQKLIKDFGNNHITTSAIRFTSDGKFMLIGGFAKSFSIPGGQIIFRTVEKDTETLEDYAYTVDISPDNKNFLIAKMSKVEIWDIVSGSRKKVIRDSKLVENSACYSRNAESIVYLRKNGELVVVSSATYKVIKKQKLPASAPLTIAAAPAGNKILIGTKESIIIIYDLNTYNLSIINIPVAETRLIRFASDGTMAAGASLTGKIWLGSYPSLESVTTWQAHPEGLTSVSFHPSGRFLASGGKDKIIRIWSLPDCSEFAAWEAHKLAVASVEFTPDGSGLASGSVNDVLAKGGEDTRLWSFDAPSAGTVSVKAEDKITLIPKQVSQTPVQQGTPQKRLALIIGNGNYSASVLANPENDAREMKSVMEQYGFDVLKYENLNQSQMKRAMDEFGEKLKNYDVGLFFYAGHGIQAKGYNYLIPVDADLRSEEQVEYDCVQADRILGLMEASGTTVNIMILDACRNNPFERSWTRAANGRGLAYMNAPSGTLIAYATAPGSTASDGSGRNGLYTSAILESIKIPDITILQMFQNVRGIVSQKSNKQQVPWESTSLTGDFYFFRTNPENR